MHLKCHPSPVRTVITVNPCITSVTGKNRIGPNKSGHGNFLLVFSMSETFLCHYSERYVLMCPSSTTQRVPAASPSAHSISTTTPDRTRFPRGSSSRSTFHGEQLRERRGAAYNGPPASPSHETGAFAHARRGTSTGIISKITSKFVRRSVPTSCGVFCPLGINKEDSLFSLVSTVIFQNGFMTFH